jgi:hypothetical protein
MQCKNYMTMKIKQEMTVGMVYFDIGYNVRGIPSNWWMNPIVHIASIDKMNTLSCLLVLEPGKYVYMTANPSLDLIS